MPTDTHPSNSILAAGSTFQAVNLPANSRTPTQYTITTTAGAVNATSLQLSSNAAVTLYKGSVLTFGASSVVLNADANLTSTPTAIAVLPLAQAVSAGTTTTYGWANLLGIQDMSEDSQASMISIRAMESGRYDDQRIIMLSTTMQFSGWYSLIDSAMKNVIRPSFRNGSEIFFQANYTDGEVVRGVAALKNLQRQAKLDDVQKYSFSLQINGPATWGTTAWN